MNTFQTIEIFALITITGGVAGVRPVVNVGSVSNVVGRVGSAAVAPVVGNVVGRVGVGAVGGQVGAVAGVAVGQVVR